jgi:hypothetical protein
VTLIERYITAQELAEVMGVAVKTIRRLTSLGMPSESLGGLARTRRHRGYECLACALARAEARDHDETSGT